MPRNWNKGDRAKTSLIADVGNKLERTPMFEKKLESGTMYIESKHVGARSNTINWRETR